VWQRAAIASAGVAVNAVVAWAMMTSILLVWGLSTVDVAVMKPTSASSPAAMASMQTPALIQTINGQPIKGFFAEERLQEVVTRIKASPNQPIAFVLQKLENDPKTKQPTIKTQQFQQLSVTPNADGKIGIALGGIERTIPIANPVQASGLATRFLSNFVVKNFQALGQMVTGHLDTRQLSGPISIVKVGAKLIDDGGIQKGLTLTAIISIILAVMNLLPIPALDGGHLLFIFLEALRGKPVKKHIQEKFMQAGFVGLLLLMGFVLWNDVYNTFLHPSPMPF
jgi:regulator of sigma E protease